MKNIKAGSQPALRRPLGVLVAVAALLLLESCATNPRMTLVPPVSVVVARLGEQPVGYTCYRSDTNTLICVSQDPIEVPGAMDDNNTLTWTLVTPGWRFADRGIDIKPRGHWNLVSSSDTSYSFSARKNGKTYKYEINVTPTTGAAKTQTWDPSIMN